MFFKLLEMLLQKGMGFILVVIAMMKVVLFFLTTPKESFYSNPANKITLGDIWWAIQPIFFLVIELCIFTAKEQF